VTFDGNKVRSVAVLVGQGYDFREFGRPGNGPIFVWAVDGGFVAETRGIVGEWHPVARMSAVNAADAWFADGL